MDKFEFTHTSLCCFEHSIAGGRAGFVLCWGCKHIGFGEITFSYNQAVYGEPGTGREFELLRPASQLHWDTEHMSDEFVKAAFNHWLDTNPPSVVNSLQQDKVVTETVLTPLASDNGDYMADRYSDESASDYRQADWVAEMLRPEDETGE